MHIYIAGIGGAGLGPLAQLSLDCGYTVSGSDLSESLLTAVLAKKGIGYSLDQSGKYLEEVNQANPIDLYVFSSAVRADNPEYQTALKLGIKTTKRSGLLNTILQDEKLKLLAVAGTHGKTTTTAMCVWLFKQLSIPVSYSIGTTLSWAPAAQYQEGSEWFVYEADEFDRILLDFKPEIGLVTSFDYDHPDTYPTQQEYLEAFQQFCKQSQLVVTWSDLAQLFEVRGAVHALREVESHTHLSGEHNRKNATLALRAVQSTLSEKIDPHAISNFPGTDRRFEKIANNLYSDYAHHPTEIAATLQLAREVNPKVVVVYQPHQNLRQYEVKGEYKNCFAGAERVYWLPTYLSREKEGLAVLTPEELTGEIVNTEVVISQLDDALLGDLKAELANGALVVAMGAGSIDAWVRKFFR